MKVEIDISTEKIEKYEAKVEKSFQELLNLVAPANRDKMIELWSVATLNSEWLGWERGYEAGSRN